MSWSSIKRNIAKIGTNHYTSTALKIERKIYKYNLRQKIEGIKQQQKKSPCLEEIKLKLKETKNPSKPFQLYNVQQPHLKDQPPNIHALLYKMVPLIQDEEGDGQSFQKKLHDCENWQDRKHIDLFFKFK